MTIKKTPEAVEALDNLKTLFYRCDNERYIAFLKENYVECFPPKYFKNMFTIKFRFDSLKFHFENGMNPLMVEEDEKWLNDIGYSVFGDTLDFGNYDLSTGTYLDRFANEEDLIYVQDPENIVTPNLNSNRKVSQKEITKSSKKDYILEIETFHELVPAIKCILWNLDNEPTSIRNIFNRIKVCKDGAYKDISKEDYEVTNKLVSNASKDKELVLEKQQISGKIVFLYRNPSNKRNGYFFDGKLVSLENLAKLSEINSTTLYMRLKKMSAKEALQKKV
jgi:hypothetical protein